MREEDDDEDSLSRRGNSSTYYRARSDAKGEARWKAQTSITIGGGGDGGGDGGDSGQQRIGPFIVLPINCYVMF